MYINGNWDEKLVGGRFDVCNPANGEKIADVPDGGREDAERAINAASAAFPDWSATTAYERARLLNRAWQIMQERKEELARTMTEEQGKPLRAARNEVQYAADFFQWYAEEAKRVYGTTVPSTRADQRFIIAW